jgi:hypothetical protein
LQLGTHDGEHEIDAAWIGDAIRRADGLARMRPRSAAAGP